MKVAVERVEDASAMLRAYQASLRSARTARAPRDARLPRELLRRAVRFVNDNLESKLRWEELAAVVGLDPFSFARAFRLATGMTPRQYVIRCRIRKAMHLLPQDSQTLADIALAVGCSCQSHLTTLFRKYIGTTPGAFRRAAKNAAS